MTILCIFLMIFSLSTLAFLQINEDKQQNIISDLSRQLAMSRRENYRKDHHKKRLEQLELENRELIEGNLNNQKLIDELTDQLRDYKQAESISVDEVEDVHSELTCYVDHLRDSLSSLECSISDIENELSRLDGLL